LTRATEIVALPLLAERQGADRRRLPPCHDTTGITRPPRRTRHLVGQRRATRAPISPRSRRRVRQHNVGVLLGQRRDVDWPCGSSSVTTRDASDQFLPSRVFVRAPVPRRFPSGSNACARPSEISSASRQHESLRWPPRGPFRISPLQALSSRCDAWDWRTSDTPVAARPEPLALARLVLSSRSPRSHPPRPRERSGAGKTIRGAFHRSRTFAPQRPLGRPAPDFTSRAVWPPRCPLPTPLHTRGPCEGIPRELGRRPRVPLPAGSRFSRPRSPLADFCNRMRRTGTPFRAADPRTRAGLAPCCSPASAMPVASARPVRRHTGGLRAMIRSRRLSLRRDLRYCPSRADRGRGASRAEAPEQRRFARSFEYVARALLLTPRAPGSPARFGPAGWRPARLFVLAEIPLGCRPAKSDTVERIRVPSDATEPLRERRIAPSCAPGPRPPHAAFVEGIARELARLLYRFDDAQLLTR